MGRFSASIFIIISEALEAAMETYVTGRASTVRGVMLRSSFVVCR